MSTRANHSRSAASASVPSSAATSVSTPLSSPSRATNIILVWAVLVLCVWLGLQLIAVSVLPLLSWGNYVDYVLYHRSFARALPLAWAGLRAHGLKRYGVAPPLSLTAQSPPPLTAQPIALNPLALRSFNPSPSAPPAAVPALFPLPANVLRAVGQWACAPPAWFRAQGRVELVRDLFLQRLGPAPAEPVDACAVHLRLGDVPFVRNRDYQLPTLACIKDAVALASSVSFSARDGRRGTVDVVPSLLRVILVCSTRHRADPRKADAGERLARAVAAELGAELWLNRPELDDLCLLRDARARVTFTSSFAFYAALASRHAWINVGRNPMAGVRDGVWDVVPREVAHCDVVDYFDTDQVLEHMKR